MRIGIYAGRFENGRGGMAAYCRGVVEYLVRRLSDAAYDDIDCVLYCDEQFLVPEFREALDIAPVLYKVVNSCDLRSARYFLDRRRVDYRFRLVIRCLPSLLGRKFGYLLDQALLPLVAARDGVDVLHSTANIAVLYSRIPQIVTVHDLFQAWPPKGETEVELEQASLSQIVTELMKGGVSNAGHLKASLVRAMYKKAYSVQFQRVALVICDCDSVMKEVCERYILDRYKTVVIALGLDAEFRHYLEDYGDRQKLFDVLSFWRESKGMPKRPVLIFASSDPRKNLPRVIQVLDRVDKEKPIVAICLDKGARDILEKSGFRSAAKGGSQDSSHRRICLDPLPRDEMPLLFACARVVFVPTLGEGFGLPVIESLAAGTPVIAGELPHIVSLCSKCASIERYVSCNPLSEDSMLEALGRVMDMCNDADPDHVICRKRDSFGVRFRTMDDMAKEVLENYLKVAGANPRMRVLPKGPRLKGA